jgi:hypothetical protein
VSQDGCGDDGSDQESKHVLSRTLIASFIFQASRQKRSAPPSNFFGAIAAESEPSDSSVNAIAQFWQCGNNLFGFRALSHNQSPLAQKLNGKSK